VEPNESFEIDSKWPRYFIGALGVGVLAFAYALFNRPEQAWVNFLVNSFYFVSLALSGTFFLALTGVTSASWMTPYKRVVESMTHFLPWCFLLLIGLYFGIHSLYEWSHADVMANDPILKLKAAYLNTPFFMLRAFGALCLWVLLSKLLISLSEREDKEGSSDSIRFKYSKNSAITLVVFAFSFSMVSFDWIMSLEPHWFSTIFGVYTFSGLFVAGISFITLSILILQKMGYFKGVVTEDHYHDLGKWIFAFSTFWAYIWISQYLLIWYSNLPEETPYFILRSQHTWDWIFWTNLVVNWVIPFFALMSRNSKRSGFILSRVCVLLLIGHWLDIYLMVAPKVYEHAGLKLFSVGVVEVLMALGFAGGFLLVFVAALKKKKLLPKNDPYFAEGVHLHQ
jgi:hypothetical protein